MSRKIKTIIIALGVVALLGGGYYGATIYQKKKAASAPSPYSFSGDPSPRLGNLESMKLVKIEVPDIVLEKTDDRWELTSLEGKVPPEGIELDQSQIRSMTYSLASIWTDRLLEEEPQDLSIYGLDNPFARASVTDSDGKRVGYIMGDMTPSRSSYYFMEEGNPAVFIVSSYTVENLLFGLDKIRHKSLFPPIDLSEMTLFQVETPAVQVAISLKPAQVPPHLSAGFSSHIMTVPYHLPRGVDSEALHKLFETFNDLTIGEIIDDNPLSLAPYGLDRPSRLFIETIDESMELFIGNPVNGMHYVRLGDAPRVFTLGGLSPVLSIRPFTLVDKFALLVNITSVDLLTVTGGGGPSLSAEFRDAGEDWETFYLNGKRTDTKSFKQWYQAVIGLLSDAEYPGPARTPDASGGEIIIEYQLHTFPGERVFITLVPYDRDFYALLQDGSVEFLISRNQVRRIWDTAQAMVYF